MKLLATADLHFNHPRSRKLAIELIERINTLHFDILLLVGDTATGEGDDLERCLSLFTHAGPKLFVAGNHELWSRQPDTYHLFTQVLPKRLADLGWHWLEGHPYLLDGVAFVGTVGWYDYSFAPNHLGIPARFYQAKVSPGAADRLSEYAHLLADRSDIREEHYEIVARWNDGKHVRLQRPDEQFLAERLADLEASLLEVRHARQVIAAVHHLPCREMLPPRHTASWDFAWAYLGSPAIGEMLRRFANVTHILSGHSHLPYRGVHNGVELINIGSGYRQKQLLQLDL